MRMNPDIPNREDRLVTGIDVLRGLFAVLVVVAHASAMVFDSRASEVAGFSERLFETVMRQGLLWVIGFFVLSGFCIHRSVVGMLMAGDFDFRQYLRARVTRIYPFYLIGFALALVAGMLERPDEITAGKVAAALTMTQSLFGMLPAFAISWSLTHEMAYYIAYGWLVRHTKGDWRRVFTLGIGLSVLGTLVVFGLWVALGKFGGGVSPPWAIPMMMLIWLAGAAMACHWEKMERMFQSSRRLGLGLGISFAALYPVYIGYWLYSNRLLPLQLINVAWIPFFCLLLLALPRLSWLDGMLIRRVAGKLGLLSYPLYLLHLPLQSLMGSLWPSWQKIPMAAQWFLLASFPVLFCWFAAIPVESRLLTWRRRYLKSCSKRL